MNEKEKMIDPFVGQLNILFEQWENVHHKASTYSSLHPISEEERGKLKLEDKTLYQEMAGMAADELIRSNNFEETMKKISDCLQFYGSWHMKGSAPFAFIERILKTVLEKTKK